MAKIAGEEKERRIADQKLMNEEKTKFNQSKFYLDFLMI